MTVLTLEKNSQGVLQLVGNLSFDAITSRFWQSSSELLIALPSPIHIDLQSVAQSDSAGVALLIAWTRLLRKHKKEICFLQVPDQVRMIMRVSGLEKLLTIK
jgi:phospholipid transport system transporter-binding protein